jgi:hypothetical protein
VRTASSRRVAVRDRNRKSDKPLSAEAVETLVWLASSDAVDRRAYTIMNRLRGVRDSEDFGTLPEALRNRVQEILASRTD